MALSGLAGHNAFWLHRIDAEKRRGQTLASTVLDLARQNSGQDDLEVDESGGPGEDDDDDDDDGDATWADAQTTQPANGKADDGEPRQRFQIRRRLPSNKTSKKVTLWNILKELIGQVWPAIRRCLSQFCVNSDLR